MVRGAVPTYHQTDNSSAATHKLGREDSAADTGKRGDRAFNDEYLALMAHLSLKPRTTGIGEKEQNGSIESTSGALKSALERHLLLRASRDFGSRDAYVAWLGDRTGLWTLGGTVSCAIELVGGDLSYSSFWRYSGCRHRCRQPLREVPAGRWCTFTITPKRGTRASSDIG